MPGVVVSSQAMRTEVPQKTKDPKPQTAMASQNPPALGQFRVWGPRVWSGKEYM